MSLWTISRYWNRFAYFVMDCGKAMLWDQTKRNADLMGNIYDVGTREILTAKRYMDYKP